MEELTPREIEQYRSRLEQMKDELLRLIGQGDDETGPVELDQTSVGRLSRMDAMQRQAMAQETERRRHNELRKMEAALKRIEEGEYGYCISTGEPIPRARLDLDPGVATIVKQRN
ncbi:MAG: TraR/DksA family transcriptional regulator [Hyphomicrobiales bacterium]